MTNRHPITRLEAFFKAFPDGESCVRYMAGILYPNGFICPRCGNKVYGVIKGRRAIQCTACRRQESVTAGTVMHGSHIPLFGWLLAIFLVTHDKRGYSAVSLAHELKISRRSAYFMLERIRSVAALKAIGEVLGGWVEIDDAYIGSKGTTRGRGTEKAEFIVAVEKSKGGGVCIRATESLKGGDYKEFARCHISATSKITSDGLPALRAGLSSYAGHMPSTFDSTDDTYALPTVHHIISNFKAHIAGTYHGVRKSHLQSYMDEFCYRYNNRRNVDIFHTLLTDVCLSPKRVRSKLIELFAFQDIEALKKVA